MNGSKIKRIERFIAKRRDVRGEPLLLRGDASTRSFYRVPFRGGTAVMVVYEAPSPAEERDYISVRDHLASCGVGVPEIYAYDAENGILLVEDFGDLSLEERLRDAAREEFERYYRRAIDEMLLIHVAATSRGGDCVAYGRAFDSTKLMEELDFFLRHTIEGHFGATLGGRERGAVQEAFRLISEELASFPRVFTHRDYHSRNLMITADTLGVVDFQDARMGPCQYDIASLLRDSYTVIDDDLREEMIGYYLRRSAEWGVEWSDAGEFRRRFDLMCLQRNIKACGTFGFMAGARGNRRYLRYIGPTWAYVRGVAPRFPRLKECVTILSRCIK